MKNNSASQVKKAYYFCSYGNLKRPLPWLLRTTTSTTTGARVV